MSIPIAVIGGRPIEVVDTETISGEIPAITYEKKNTKLTWNGGKFPKKLLMQTVAFSKYCYDTYGGEVQGRLYYNKRKKRWKVIVLPQFVSRTLESEEIEDHADRLAMLAPVDNDEWDECGTWHSHAQAKAFQSATDYKDEIIQPGLHYTLGSMCDEVNTFHSRYNVRKVFYDIDDKEIMQKHIVKISQCKAFPIEWVNALHERPARPAVSKYNRYNNTPDTPNWREGYNNGSLFADRTFSEVIQGIEEANWREDYGFDLLDAEDCDVFDVKFLTKTLSEIDEEVPHEKLEQLASLIHEIGRGNDAVESLFRLTDAVEASIYENSQY